ncbi:MAG: hypothetical protein HFJ46_06380 [Clostridia bacterium]|nr:hypothetical protein [Clostridia bacterium]
MKKMIIITIILITILILGIAFWNYKEKQEDIRIYAEAVTLKQNLEIEYGKEITVSDCLEKLNGTLIEDKNINTETLGEVKVNFEFFDIRNKKRFYEFTVKIIDINPPKIFSGSSFTVKVGYSKNLTDVLLSGDDIDDNPKREILGEYDFNTAGEYNLKYVVTDSSGNKTEKDFVLYVKEKIEDKQTERDTIEFADVINNYKTENTKIGIDVSKWQEEINWQEVKDAGVEFVMIRMGYQTEYDGEYKLDSYFNQNINGAKEVGLPVGVYFYSYAKNVKQAIDQANWVKENLKDYEIDLPVVFDWESWNSFNTTGMSFNTINKVANTFLDVISENGYKGMLYSSKNYLEKIWYPTKYDIWLAQYNNKVTYEGEYSIWQMCDTGKIAGINEPVDIDIMYEI